MGTGRRKNEAMKLELTSATEEWLRGQWGPRSGLEGERWKLVSESEEGARGRLHRPGCPREDVSFYKVKWGAVSGSLWPACCWQGQGDQLGASCDHPDERYDGLHLWWQKGVVRKGDSRHIVWRQSLRICCGTRPGWEKRMTHHTGRTAPPSTEMAGCACVRISVR